MRALTHINTLETKGRNLRAVNTAQVFQQHLSGFKSKREGSILYSLVVRP